MNLIPVVSSNVSAIGYENGVIEVHFHNAMPIVIPIALNNYLMIF